MTDDLDAEQCTQVAVACGGLGDVFKGALTSGGAIAIKCARAHTIKTDLDYMQVRLRCAICW